MAGQRRFSCVTRAVGACLPRVVPRTVPGASHAVHAQQVGINELVRDFLDRD
jgi:hypothetical protein